MQLLNILRDIFNFIYPLIGIIAGLYGLKKSYDSKKKEENAISFQIAMINQTLRTHEEQDKETKESISKIEQEQDKQNISISEMHTKLDILCKASNIDKRINKDDKKGSR